MSEDKLKKLNDRIDKMYEKIENNEKISQEKKEKLLAILEGLKDTVEEKLKMYELESQDVIDEVLNIVN
jgi:hypothetical protein